MIQSWFSTALIQRKPDMVDSETALINAVVFHIFWMSAEKQQLSETALFSADYLWDFHQGPY